LDSPFCGVNSVVMWLDELELAIFLGEKKLLSVLLLDCP
jgi:hypothetical protein